MVRATSLPVEAQAHSACPANVMQWPSGLTAIHQPVPATPVVVADVWVQAGSRREPAQWLGMAHFLEHMIFKGTERIAPGAFDRAIEQRGGTANAATSHDYAHFFITAAATDIERTLPELAELLLHARIPEGEFDCERDVVLEELNGCHDDPDWWGFQALCESLYPHHPYGRPILGTAERLQAHSPEDMRRFHRAHYQPENVSVALVGGIEQQRARALIESAFSAFAPRSEAPPVAIEPDPPLATIRRQQIRSSRIEQARLLMGWRGPGTDCLDDAVGLDVLSALLGEGRSSRLVQELREQKQLVQDIGCEFSLQRDSSLIAICALLPLEHAEAVEAIVRDRLRQLQQVPVAAGELARAQRLLCNDYAFSTETPGQLAGLYGYYSTVARLEQATSYPHRVRQIGPQDLQRLAAQYLSPDRYAVTLVKPDPDA